MSEEHVVADWVIRAFARSRKRRSDLSGTFVAPKQMRLSNDEPFDTAKVVCKSCNNVWLSRIDNAAAAVLKPLIQGKTQVRLTAAAQRTAAAWLFKSALIFDAFSYGNGGPLAGLRSAFAESQLAPPGVTIFAGPAPHTPFRVEGIPEIAGLALFGVRPIAGRLNLTINIKNPDGSVTPGKPSAIPMPGYLVMLGRLQAMTSGLRGPIIPTPGQGFVRLWPVTDGSVTLTSEPPPSEHAA